MQIYPAIDIRGGRCVRLLKGDYAQETVYGDSPLAMARQFANDGATWLHMVDLDGAKAGEPVNDDHVLQIKQALDVHIEIGGGIRSEQAVCDYLDAGVDRVILGSSAIADPDFVKRMLAMYGERIVIGIDARDGYVAVDGWLKTSEVTATDLALELIKAGAAAFIFTDISKDGTLAGPNIAAIQQLAEVTQKEVIASGGVSTLEDLRALQSAGVPGAIIGRALYTGAFTVADALKVVT